MTTCTLHRVETNVSCRTCGTPVCPDCLVRTPRGVTCAEHAGGATKEAVVTSPSRRGASGSGRRVLIGALAVLVVAAAVIFLRPSGGRNDVAGGAWKPMPSAGLASRTDFSYLSTGKAMIVWGGSGEATLGDGAAFDLASSTWTPLAASPLAARRGHTAVWTGTAMIVFGGRGPAAFNDGASYDPSTNRWAPIAPAPLVSCKAVPPKNIG